MTRRGGAALAIALLVVVMAGAVVTGTLAWAVLQQQAGRAWRAAGDQAAGLESAAARWRGGDTTGQALAWPIADSLLVIRVSGTAEAGLLELACWRAPTDSVAHNCVPHRGFLRGPR
jgi:hypothetical protein